jgi:hypothetical protein
MRDKSLETDKPVLLLNVKFRSNARVRALVAFIGKTNRICPHYHPFAL